MRDENTDRRRGLLVPLSDFAWQALEDESARLNVPIEELVSFAALYYIADADSGRIARNFPAIPQPQQPLS